MKKWLKRVAIGLPLMVALAIVIFVVNWYWTRAAGLARRDSLVARLDAEDPGWRFADLIAARNATLPPQDRNAAEVVVSAAKLAPKSVNGWIRDEQHAEMLNSNHLPDKKEYTSMTALSAACGPALKAVRPIRELSGGGFRQEFRVPNPLTVTMPYVADVAQVVHLLDLDAAARSYQGRPNEALESAHLILGVGQTIGDEPLFVMQAYRIMVGTSAKRAVQRTLAWGKPTTGLAEMQAAFAAELKFPRLRCAARGERGMYFTVLQNLEDDKLGVVDLVESFDSFDSGVATEIRGGLQNRIATTYVKRDVPGHQATVLEWFDQLLSFDSLPEPERTAALETLEPPSIDFGPASVRFMSNSWKYFRTADLRARAVMSATIVALACERYRLKFSAWPATLAAISQDILPELPTDPYTGGPLAYKIVPDGAVIYATGPDRTDDGGVTLNDFLPLKGEDIGFHKGEDIGFRLWNPDKRGLPPLASPAIGGPRLAAADPNSQP
ncbi:hypothetical protein [Fimbriiglobus ruber]|uniref:Uncharacterized protein n=1 Tax=Fimbriiglobus ruber TaxID=1908690 RepID=A0A225D8B8_9BACT|nr:hypothetical protein [Fimbriiglobus ruber]OWK34788.1 hypothetical protein FRUB_09630 [Fimbriiglobus ruber]